LCQRSALALFLDDLQYADEPTLELIHYLGRRLKKQRILLIIVISQPEMDDDHGMQNLFWSLKRADCFEHVQLDKLSEYEVSLLISKTLPNRENLEQLTSWLYEESGGNPFFLIEMLNGIQEDSSFNIENIPIPYNILDFIQGRFSRLDPDCRRVLNAASVIGRNFDPRILEQLYPNQGEQTVQALAWLHNKHWFEKMHGRQSGLYDFKHGLVREVIYQSLTYEQQRHLHLQVTLA
jgi:predicted ATPase